MRKEVKKKNVLMSAVLRVKQLLTWNTKLSSTFSIFCSGNLASQRSDCVLTVNKSALAQQEPNPKLISLLDYKCLWKVVSAC